jgi:multidrug efflux pump
VGSLPGVTAFPITPPSLGQGFRDRPINFVIVTERQLRRTSRAPAQGMLAEMAKNPASSAPDIDLRLEQARAFPRGGP